LGQNLFSLISRWLLLIGELVVKFTSFLKNGCQEATKTGSTEVINPLLELLLCDTQLAISTNQMPIMPQV